MVWKTAERKVVASVEIREVPPVPPIPPVPPLPTLSFLDRHKKINKFIKHQGYYKYKCPSIIEIAEDTGFDIDVVKDHIAVMSEDESVKSVNDDAEGIICNIDSIQRLAETLRKLRVK